MQNCLYFTTLLILLIITCFCFKTKQQQINKCACASKKVKLTNQLTRSRHGVAISTLVKKPMELETWLIHHFNIGIHRIFLRVEDTPEVAAIIQTLPRYMQLRIHATFVETDVKAQSQWHTLQTRQKDFFMYVKEECLRNYEDIRWILQNLDDDELLYCSSGNVETFLATVAPDKLAIFVQTVEAFYPDAQFGDTRCFRTDTFVKCDRRELCNSYYGGKSFGLLSDDLQSNGPHHVYGDNWWGEEAEEYYKPSIDDIVILHYESCNFDRWKQKFKNLQVPENEKPIPPVFTYYNISVKKVLESDEEALKYYKTIKVDPYYQYAPKNKYGDGPFIH